jgi:hypothetical protein
MKQYLLSVWSVDGEPEPTPDQIEVMYRDVEAVNEEIRQAGAWVFAGGLVPVSSATTVKSENGEIVTTDGPFAETKEQLGGFWVIKAADLDAALEWAGKASVACQGAVEVRPFQDDAED